MKPSDLRSVLPTIFKRGRVPFLWGAVGVGKSDLAQAVADDLGIELRDVRLSLLDPIDLKGFPIPDMDKEVMRWLAADFLPPMTVKKGNKMVPNMSKGLLFLDEMNSAPPTTQAAGYQLILNRKIGQYTLPEGWHIMAAGNRTSDRSVVHAQPAALANRFVHLDYDVDLDDWAHWAVNNDIHPDLVGFIRFRPGLLHNFDAKANPRAFPTPRSWSFVNDTYKHHATAAQEFEIISGTVGEGAAAEFMGFTKLIKDLPSVDDVLLSPDTARVPESPAGMYAIAAALDPKTTTGNLARVMQYVTRLPAEYQVVFVRSAIRRDSSLTSTKAYQDWGIKNQALLT